MKKIILSLLILSQFFTHAEAVASTDSDKLSGYLMLVKFNDKAISSEELTSFIYCEKPQSCRLLGNRAFTSSEVSLASQYLYSRAIMNGMASTILLVAAGYGLAYIAGIEYSYLFAGLNDNFPVVAKIVADSLVKLGLNYGPASTVAFVASNAYLASLAVSGVVMFNKINEHTGLNKIAVIDLVKAQKYIKMSKEMQKEEAYRKVNFKSVDIVKHLEKALLNIDSSAVQMSEIIAP